MLSSDHSAEEKEEEEKIKISWEIHCLEPYCYIPISNTLYFQSFVNI